MRVIRRLSTSMTQHELEVRPTKAFSHFCAPTWLRIHTHNQTTRHLTPSKMSKIHDSSVLFLERRYYQLNNRARTIPSNRDLPTEGSSNVDESGRLTCFRLADDLSSTDLFGRNTSARHNEYLDDSSGGLSRSSLRRVDKQFFLARQSTLPENNPAWWFDRNEYEIGRKSFLSVIERPDAESSAVEEDTPKFLVFKSSMRRLSTKSKQGMDTLVR
jgi:hypothetical protein